MLKEQDIIDRLKGAFAHPDGIGDDCAIFPISEHESYVITKDILAEDVHFRRSYFDPASLAHKSLHVNLSDVASVGATPLYVLMGISLPSDISSSYTEDFLDAFSALCKKANVQLIGGDTTGSKHGIFISVTAIGRANKEHLKLRRNAKPGDIVCVCGAMGHAHAGLIALENKMSGAATLKEALLKPNARNNEGLWLGQQTAVTSMMDLSDGLYVDLQKLCRASGVGAGILTDQLMPSPELSTFCSTHNIDPLECMIAGGEDYGLLVTVQSDAYAKVAADFQQNFGYALQPAGNIIAGQDVQLTQKGRTIPFSYRPFSHFGETISAK